jgi:hypothetical protein
MVIRKQNITKPGRRKEPRSSNSTEENGNHTKKTQHGPSQIPPNIRITQKKMERNGINKSNETKRSSRRCCGVSCTSKKRQEAHEL